MFGMKSLFLFTVLVFCAQDAYSMTEPQLKNAVKMVRNICQSKIKITNAQIDNMHKGVFDDDQKLKCYMSCGLHALKFMKDGKIDYEYAKKEAKRLPPKMQGPVGKAIDDCKDSAVSDDKCEAAYQLAQCMYKSDPENYFLP